MYMNTMMIDISGAESNPTQLYINRDLKVIFKNSLFGYTLYTKTIVVNYLSLFLSHTLSLFLYIYITYNM